MFVCMQAGKVISQPQQTLPYCNEPICKNFSGMIDKVLLCNMFAAPSTLSDMLEEYLRIDSVKQGTCCWSWLLTVLVCIPVELCHVFKCMSCCAMKQSSLL